MTRAARRLLPAALRESLRDACRGALAAAYRGDRVSCPCCGGRFRRFLPFGVVRRENAMCPRCGSLERHRLLSLYLERRSGLFASALRLLHVAPERLFAARLLARPGLRYVSIDLASALAMARMDATRLAFRDSTFDAILCLHVLEHIPDDRAAMREFLRVLRPGGWAILQSPFDSARPGTFEDWSVTSPAARERVFGQRDHVRIYGRDYFGRLRESGFRVEECAFARELTPDEARRFGVDTEEAITLCTRP